MKHHFSNLKSFAKKCDWSKSQNVKWLTLVLKAACVSPYAFIYFLLPLKPIKHHWSVLNTFNIYHYNVHRLHHIKFQCQKVAITFFLRSDSVKLSSSWGSTRISSSVAHRVAWTTFMTFKGFLDVDICRTHEAVPAAIGYKDIVLSHYQL